MLSKNKVLIAYWKSRGGQYWVKLYLDQFGYTYQTDDGGGNLGKCDYDFALNKCKIQASYCPSNLTKIV